MWVGIVLAQIELDNDVHARLARKGSLQLSLNKRAIFNNNVSLAKQTRKKKHSKANGPSCTSYMPNNKAIIKKYRNHIQSEAFGRLQQSIAISR